MSANRSAQTTIAPFAIVLTAVLWIQTWAEIISKGAWHSPDDLSKLYLAIMGAYAGAAEISKWLRDEPTVIGQDPRLERIQRGGFFIALWLIPLLFAYGWRISDPKVPMPAPLQKIMLGLVGIFFIKAASRRLRHKKHGVIDPVTGAVKDDEDGDGRPDTPEADLSEAVYKQISASPDGVSVTDLLATMPQVSKPRLYRAFEELMKAKRIIRTGKPRTADVRYRIVSK